MSLVVSHDRHEGRVAPPGPHPEVVVWESDGRPLPDGGYGARLARRLRRVGHRVVVVDHRRRALTPSELAAPVHVLSGGETSAFAGDPATERSLAALRDLARRAWADEVTIVGVCLGSQLLARVLAPGLPPSHPDAGMEAGWAEVTGPAGTFGVAELHYEQIHPELASVDGVEVLLGNDHSPVQAFRWGRSVVATQFHPEWSPADLRVVLSRHRGLLAARHAAPGAARRSVAGSARRWRAEAFDALVAAPVAARLEASAPLRRAG